VTDAVDRLRKIASALPEVTRWPRKLVALLD